MALSATRCLLPWRVCRPKGTYCASSKLPTAVLLPLEAARCRTACFWKCARVSIAVDSPVVVEPFLPAPSPGVLTQSADPLLT